jgi:cell shape-determining protein MreC
MFDHYLLIVNTSKKNDELQKEVLTLQNKVFALTEIEKENDRLKQLVTIWGRNT